MEQSFKITKGDKKASEKKKNKKIRLIIKDTCSVWEKVECREGVKICDWLDSRTKEKK